MAMTKASPPGHRASRSPCHTAQRLWGSEFGARHPPETLLELVLPGLPPLRAPAFFHTHVGRLLNSASASSSVNRDKGLTAWLHPQEHKGSTGPSHAHLWPHSAPRPWHRCWSPSELASFYGPDFKCPGASCRPGTRMPRQPRPGEVRIHGQDKGTQAGSASGWSEPQQCGRTRPCCTRQAGLVDADTGSRRSALM